MDAKKLKTDLIHQVQQLLRNFEDNTNCDVVKIEITKDKCLNGVYFGRTVVRDIKVEL